MRPAAFLIALLLTTVAGCTDAGNDGSPTSTSNAYGTAASTAATASASTASSSTASSTSTPTLVHNACTAHPEYGTGDPEVTIETTLGNLTLQVFVGQVPITGMNFVKLAEDGTYDGSPFHRIITDFMAQGGDHTRGDGRGGRAHPDCADANGRIPDEFRDDLRHDAKGILSMANAGPGTGTSQFFITFVPTPHLDGKHTVFGKVVAGLDVLDRINDEAGSQTGAPRTPVTFVGATVDWG